MYLSTTDGDTDVVPLYTPTHTTSSITEIAHSYGLTNITRAFDAANQAHLHQTPQLESSSHVNIFFSDGIAGVNSFSPECPHVNDYIKGENTPSTFTVYYGSDQSAIVKLQQMTENIKNNSYSENNPEITDIISMNDWKSIKIRLHELFDGLSTDNALPPLNTKKDDIQIQVKGISPHEIHILSASGSLRVDIYTIHGRKIESLNAAAVSGAYTKVLWDTRKSCNGRIPSGRYFLDIRSREERLTRSFVVIQ